MKPYVICHMFGSVDGRIKQDIWGLKDHHKYFEETAAQIPADAWLVGRVTMQEFSSKQTYAFDPLASHPEFRSDFVAPKASDTYAVVIDPAGKCVWDTNTVSTEQVIEVLSEQVTDGYLAHLRSRNVSYVFAGKETLDLALALEKLNRLFGIERVRIDGGGHVNGAFLQAGLIDEFSLVLAPIADGTIGAPTVFEAQEGYAGRHATHFSLRSVERIYDDFLWIRYQVIKGLPPNR